MRETATDFEPQSGSGTPLPVRSVPRIPVMVLGKSLGSFLALTFVLCVLFDLWFPALAMNPVWAPLLLGFTWISWSSFSSVSSRPSTTAGTSRSSSGRSITFSQEGLPNAIRSDKRRSPSRNPIGGTVAVFGNRHARTSR